MEEWGNENGCGGEERWKRVREFRYLGNTLQKNGGQEAHVKERVRKAATMNGTGMGNWEKEVWERLRKKTLNI